MKKSIILIWILINVFNTYESNAQLECGSVPDALYLQELNNSMNLVNGCVDDFSTYNLNQEITFNLVLNYAKEGTGSGEIDQSVRNAIELDIKNVYDGQNIKFNIVWNNLDCDDCRIHLDNWPEYLTTATCIQGNVLGIDTDNSSNSGGNGAISQGKFWGYGYSIPHELGHAIGLLHTHNNDPSSTGYTDELVTRAIPYDENDPCS